MIVAVRWRAIGSTGNREHWWALRMDIGSNTSLCKRRILLVTFNGRIEQQEGALFEVWRDPDQGSCSADVLMCMDRERGPVKAATMHLPLRDKRDSMLTLDDNPHC